MKTRITTALLLLFGLLAAAPVFAQKTTKKKTETVTSSDLGLYRDFTHKEYNNTI